MQLNTIKTQTTWSEAASSINANNNKLMVALQGAIVNSNNSKHKGYYSSLEDLESAYPTGESGDMALVGTAPNYEVVYWGDSGWYNTGTWVYIADYIQSYGDSDLVGNLTVTELVTAGGFAILSNQSILGDNYIILAGGGSKSLDDFVLKSGNSTVVGGITANYLTATSALIAQTALDVRGDARFASSVVLSQGLKHATPTGTRLWLDNGTLIDITSLGSLRSANTSDTTEYEDIF